MSVNIEQSINDIHQLIKQPIYDNVIKLIKYNEGYNDVAFHFDYESYPIKITTDFNSFCLAESPIEIINTNNFNLKMVFKNKTPTNILNELLIINSIDKKIEIKSHDIFHVFQKFEEFVKNKLNYSELEKIFLEFSQKNKSTLSKNKIPKGLLLNQQQIIQLIINEIKKINRTQNYLHYIDIDKENPFDIIVRFKFDKILDKLKEFGYDYMEIKLCIDPKTYPFIPPKIEYVKPKIQLPLLFGLLNLDILKLNNWNSTITLDYLIESIGNSLKPIIENYVMFDDPSNSNLKISFDNLEYELIKLTSITKEYENNIVNINIPIPKINQNVNESKYWKSGTGYGTDGSKTWDISTYVEEQEIQNNQITDILININKLISNSNINIIENSILINYIVNQIKGLNILEFEKNSVMYIQIFDILTNIFGCDLSQPVINKIAVGIKNIYDDIDTLFKTSPSSLTIENYLQIYQLAKTYLDKYVEPTQIIVIPTDIKEQYCNIMKSLQFNNYQVPPYHRFIKNQNEKPQKQSLMRILSEISSFKSSLPLNWDSTIWTRVSTDCLNLFSFLISGPKDTPYENGLFEFHACFPPDYPSKEPKVLIHTTGNGTVRFNPNLYDSGKVCLSLLGTWSGSGGENWNPKTSTFLQVMVSIQSLILIENPYFNEPGWERDMNSESGKQKSNMYNEERKPHTIKLAMIDMIKNPPVGFEEVVRNHFKMKKEEIINNTLIWEQNATTHKKLIETNRAELIELLNEL